MIEVSGLRKQFGDLVAVNDVSFTARPGEIFGLLGPNGAGKTTTLSCISGLLRPTGGRISIQGHDVVTDGKAARRSLGVVPQEIALYEELSATQNLAYWGGLFGLAGAEPLATAPAAGIIGSPSPIQRRSAHGYCRCAWPIRLAPVDDP